MNDKDLLDKLDRLIHGDDSVSFCEEDGGVIATYNGHRIQNNYVGSNVREALEEMLNNELLKPS